MIKPSDTKAKTEMLLEGGEGNDRLLGGNKDDVIRGHAGHDELEGGKGDDILLGGKGSDVLDGGKGDDYLHGGDSADVLIGDTGKDVLVGGKGDDLLEGGPGADVLSGGRGADLFVFAKLSDMGVGGQRDIVTDFKGVAGDRIDLRGLAKSTGLAGFTFIGDAAFTEAGQLRFENELLSGNVRGSLKADFEIQLVGVTCFKAEYLML
ncbi:calcium-binding protein [Pseudomonas sp. EMN2]|uniref:calcium-binding protein n=1 Tax=Pseudomonas sp. EMN2 TaxID=2615212 RepID=UPI00129A6342|nr:calcium-binding protein [Pseudomonas sp. EMN2]